LAREVLGLTSLGSFSAFRMGYLGLKKCGEKHDTIDPIQSFQTGSRNSEGESNRIQGFGNAQFGWRVLPLKKPFAL
jgi:hypothetical protein